MKSYGETTRPVRPDPDAAANGRWTVPKRRDRRRPSINCGAGLREIEGDVRVGHAAVEHGHDHRRRGAGVDIPRALHVEQRIVPLQRVERIVGPERAAGPGSAPARTRTSGCAASRRATASGSAFRIEGDDIERRIGERRRRSPVNRPRASAARAAADVPVLNLTMRLPGTYRAFASPCAACTESLALRTPRGEMPVRRPRSMPARSCGGRRSPRRVRQHVLGSDGRQPQGRRR